MNLIPVVTRAASEHRFEREAEGSVRLVTDFRYIPSVTTAIPPGRTGTTDEIAKAFAFLASDESSYITGSEFFADGGQGQI